MSLHVSIEIFDALHELLRIFRTRMRQSLESVSPDLTFGELRVLMHVGEHPDCAQKALVERCHVDKAQMARLLAQLEDKGWLTRSECAPEFAKEIFGHAEVGVLPRLVHSRFGLHVVEVLERHHGTERAFESVRAAAAVTLRQKAFATALRQYLHLLTEKAVIEGVDMQTTETPLAQ